jgi:hypothetical protein
MAIFKFYQIYRSIREVLGDDTAQKLFPEYSSLPDKMLPNQQAQLAKILMDRLDESLDRDTIAAIRRKHSCNISKGQAAQIDELKKKCSSLDEFCAEYSKLLSPGYVKKDGNLLTVSFGWGKCVCGTFRKLDDYEPVSKTWCECCNGHVIKTFSMICGKPVESVLVEGAACGGRDCVFKVKI